MRLSTFIVVAWVAVVLVACSAEPVTPPPDVLIACGNGILEASAGEICDDGNVVAGDGCAADCRSNETCGNGIVDVVNGEVCDDGDPLGGPCAPDCTSDAGCGDGVVAPGAGEECDDGNANDADDCVIGTLPYQCKVARCGDGIVAVDATGPRREQCDAGSPDHSSPGPVETATCNLDCTVAVCGDGKVNGHAGEQCDDGNIVNGDGCDNNCTSTGCGNGIVNAGEACDDGNLVNGDGCDSNCTLTGCGNGIVSLGEMCDDGNFVDGDGCDSNCTVTACGNCIVTAGEVCDDCNTTNGDGCNSNCMIPECGDGIVSGAEECDDGNITNGDGCDSNCTLTACGNGIVTAGEQCDDGNQTNNDGCDNDCTVSTISTSTYIKASNAGPGGQFGDSVALSADGSTLAVGAPFEAGAATGVNGDQLDDSAPGAGAVYVFTRAGGTWIQQAYIKASNTDENDLFGWQLALSADGSTLAVAAFGESSAATGINGDQLDDSAWNAGAVYVFTRSGTTWSQQAYVKASNPSSLDFFGWSLALSGDGATLAVSARYEASAAVGINGNQADDSAPNAGAVYVFTRSGTMWSQQAYVKASNTGAGDEFGRSVALSNDGSTLAVSAFYEDSAAIGINGNQLDDSAWDAGAVYVFTRSGTTWSQQTYVKASNTDMEDAFGYRIGLSGDGATLAVSARYEDSAATGVNGDQLDNSAEDAGAVYVLARSGTTWSQQAYVKASNTAGEDAFGYWIALSSDGANLAVGSIWEASATTGIGGNQADNSAVGAGAVYLLRRSGTTWSQQAYVKASNTQSADLFGSCVGLSGNGSTLAVGAIWEDSAATGVGGDQTSNSATDAGAVYVFD